MVQQKKKNEAIDLGDAVSKSEAFLLKNKKAIIGAIAAIIIITAVTTIMKLDVAVIGNIPRSIINTEKLNVFTEDGSENILTGVHNDRPES